MNNMEIKVSVKDIPEVIEQLEIADKKINDLQQENKQLKKLCDRYEEEHNKEFNIWLQGQKVLKDLEEWLKEEIENIIEESLSPDRYCLVHNYIVSLQQKVEQLENIRKEAIKYVKNDSYFDGSGMCTNDLLNILNKGDNNVKDKR